MTTPNQSSVSGRGMRVYRWPPSGETEMEVVSVTSVIGGGIPKPFLAPWSAKMVAEFAVDRHAAVEAMLDVSSDELEKAKNDAIDWLKRAPYRGTAEKANMGTIVHAAVDAYLKDRPLSNTDIEAMLIEKRVPMEKWKATRGYVEAAFKFLKEHRPKVLHTEATIYSRTHMYSGTADVLGMMDLDGDDTPVVIDFKTSKRIYDEVGLQLCAYSRGEFVGNDDGQELPLFPDGLECRNGIGVRLMPGGKYEAIRFHLSDDLFEVFLHAQGVALGSKTIQQSRGFEL
jgi:hypothetical protein